MQFNGSKRLGARHDWRILFDKGLRNTRQQLGAPDRIKKDRLRGPDRVNTLLCVQRLQLRQQIQHQVFELTLRHGPFEQVGLVQGLPGGVGVAGNILNRSRHDVVSYAGLVKCINHMHSSLRS